MDNERIPDGLHTKRITGHLYESLYDGDESKVVVKVIKRVGNNNTGGWVYLCHLEEGKYTCWNHDGRCGKLCKKYIGGSKQHVCYYTGFLYPLDPLEQTLEQY